LTFVFATIAAPLVTLTTVVQSLDATQRSA
jgi:hypothetical protein